MSITPIYDASGRFKNPTIVLCHRNFEKIGTITPIQNWNITPDLQNTNECSFTIHKYNDNILLPLWDKIMDLRVIYIPEYNEYFEIGINKSVSNDITKSIVGTNLGVAELSQTKLNNIEINTDADIARDDYIVAKIYDPGDIKHCLLGRVLSKTPHYSIAHVDDTLAGLVRSFSINGSTTYDFLVNTLAKELNCLITVDSSTRSISLYDLEDYCNDCGTRHETTNGVCPKCGSTNITYGYGEDTSIYMSIHNLASNIQVSTNKDDVKNTFRVLGGDDVISAAVLACNPNGTAYINRFSEEMKNDMSDELKIKLEEYDELYLSYQDEYRNVMKKIYDGIDEILYLTSGMMPSVDTDDTDANKELAKLTAQNIGDVAVQNIKYSGLTTVNNAVKSIAQVLLAPGYKVTIASSTYQKQVWKGKFTVTSEDDEEDTATNSVNIAIAIDADYETFISQKVKKMLKKQEMQDEEDIDYTKYCLNSLSSFSDAYQSCLDILIEEGMGKETNQFYKKIYYPYYKKKLDCDAEIKVRETQIAKQEEIQNKNEKRSLEIQEILNLEKFIGKDLWYEYCSFRREDDYQNNNYISDGLDNGQIIAKASELFETAQKEIYKASETQYTLTATIGNFFGTTEFEPFKKQFVLGNWIRFEADGIIYKLRLLNYTIKDTEFENLEVVFSNVMKISSGLSDVQSVLSSAKSMATSYDSVKRQAKQGKKTQEELNNWLQNGIDATAVAINNSENPTVTFDGHGLLLRSYDELSEEYSPELIRIINNTIAMSDDNGTTYKVAFGKYQFVDPETGETKTAYGFLGDTIVGNLLIGEQMMIGNNDGTVKMDSNGFVVSNEDDSSYLKFVKLPNGNYKLEVAADDIKFGESKISISDEFKSINKAISDVDRSISSVTTQYYLSSSKTELADGSWVNLVPEYLNGKYYWTREWIKFDNSTEYYSTPVLNYGLTNANENAYDAKQSVSQIETVIEKLEKKIEEMQKEIDELKDK